MATYEIQIDDKVLNEKIQDILNDAFNRQLNKSASSLNQVIAEACKDLVYANKDEIIDKVVERASREIAKRGLVKLLERESQNG